MPANVTELEKLVVRLLADDKQYQRTIDRVEKRTAAMARKLTATGAKMTAAITLPILAMGAVAVREFARFDQAMTQSTSIMDVTAEQTAKMRDLATELGGQTIQGPTKLAESYFFLASAGLSAEEAMAALPGVAAFATAGAFDMALATDLLTDAQSSLGLATGDTATKMANMTRLADVLVKANTLANASVAQFSTALTSKAGAALKSYNKDVEEGVAVLAALADQGIKAELAGNALDRVTRLLSKSALDNKSAHEQLGFSVFDNTGKMRNYADIIENLEQITGNMSDEARSAALDQLGFSARVQGVILPLLGTSAAIRKYEAELRKAGGTTKNVADKQIKSFSNQMTILKNNLSSVAIEIGSVLAPFILKLNERIQQGIRWWKSLDTSTKRWIIALAAAAAAIGPVLLALGAIGGAVAGMIAAASAVGSVIAAVASALPVIAGVAAAVVGLGLLVGKEGLANAWETARSTAARFWSGLLGFMANFQHNIMALYTWFVDNWKNILKDALQLYWNYLKALPMNLFTVWKTMQKLWITAFGWLVGRLKQVFTVDFLNQVIAGGKVVLSYLGKLATNMWALIKAGVTGGPGGIAGLLEEFGTAFVTGMENKDLGASLREVLQQGMGEIILPWDDFESSITDGPDLKFGRSSAKALEKAGEDGGKSLSKGMAEGVEKALDEPLTTLSDLEAMMNKGGGETAEEETKKTFTIDFNVTGVDAMKAGSVEALAALEAFHEGMRQRQQQQLANAGVDQLDDNPEALVDNLPTTTARVTTDDFGPVTGSQDELDSILREVGTLDTRSIDQNLETVLLMIEENTRPKVNVIEIVDADLAANSTTI